MGNWSATRTPSEGVTPNFLPNDIKYWRRGRVSRRHDRLPLYRGYTQDSTIVKRQRERRVILKLEP